MSNVAAFFVNEWHKSPWTTRIFFAFFMVGLMTFSLASGIVNLAAGLASLIFFLPLWLLWQSI